MKSDRKSPVMWEKKSPTISYSVIELAIIAAADFFVWALMISAFYGELETAWQGFYGNRTLMLEYLIIAIVLAAVIDVLIPWLRIRIVKSSEWKITIVGAVAVTIAGAAAGSLVYLSNKDNFISGMKTFTNKIMSDYAGYYSDGFGSVSIEAGNAPVFVAGALIIYMTLMWLVTLLCNIRFIWLLLPVTYVSFEMMIGLVPGWEFVMRILMAVSLILIYRRYKGIMGVRRVKRRSGRSFLRLPEFKQWLTGTVFILALAGIVTSAVKPFSDEKMKVYKREKTVSETAAFEELYEYIIAYINPDNSRKITNIPPVFADETICNFTVSEPVSENIYLRDYIGESYAASTWNYDEAKFKAACREAGIKPADARDFLAGAMYGAMAISDSATLKSSVNFNTVRQVKYTITYGDNIRVKAPMPYYVEPGNTEGKILSDILWQKKIFAKETSFDALATLDFTNSGIRYLSSLELSEEEIRIRDWYDSYVMENYTGHYPGVPTAAKAAKRIKKPCPDTSVYKTNKWRLDMAEEVGKMLSTYDFNWSLDEISEDVDTVEYFIGESHEGYNIHFASAGTLILREMGIPARYVEGYILNGKAIKYDKNREKRNTLVLDRDKHAWTEVYLDHIGWVPVEMTVSYTIVDKNLQTGQESKELRTKIELITLNNGETNDEPWLEYSVADVGSEGLDVNVGISYGDTGPTEFMDNPFDNQEELNRDTGEGEEVEVGISPDESDSEDRVDVSPEENDEPEPEETDEEGNESVGDNQTTEDTDAMPDETYENPVQETFSVALVAFGVSLVLIVIAIFVISLVVKNRRKAFRTLIEKEIEFKHYTMSVKILNRSIYKKLKSDAHFIKTYLKDSDYEANLIMTYPEVSASDWDKYMRIAKAAAFSQDEVSQEDAEFCYKLYGILNQETDKKEEK